jgi:quaternary ammonium compound-resistance protein SugE
MSWVYLLFAGLAEIAWSQSLKPTDGFTRLWPTLLSFVLIALAVYPLTLAMREIPVGTAYAIFTGIGAVGAVSLGVIIHGDPLTAGRILAVSLIVSGVICARIVSG